MEWSPPSGEVAETVTAVLKTYGAALVELAVQRVQSRTHLSVVAYRPGGIDLDTLADVHRLLRPRLEAIQQDDNLHVEFSSPGIGRTFKNGWEFAVFRGNGVTLFEEGGARTDGTITDADASGVTLVVLDGEERFVPFQQITKARLRD